jgi:hypothetical protein
MVNQINAEKYSFIIAPYLQEYLKTMQILKKYDKHKSKYIPILNIIHYLKTRLDSNGTFSYNIRGNG